MSNLIWKGFCTRPGAPKGGMYFVFQCLYCQRPFVSPGYEVNCGRMKKYCSNNCQMFSEKRIESVKKSLKGKMCGIKNPRYKDGGTMYTKFRKEFCELCGKTAENHTRKGKIVRLLVHHRDMNRRNSDPKNLRTVCFACHLRLHNPSYFGKYPDFQNW